MSKWFYKGKYITCVDDMPADAPFIVYKISFPGTGEYYWGSKQVYTVRRVKLSKKRSRALYSGRGSYPKYEVKRSESDWKIYNSSSAIVKKKLETEEAVFEIVEFMSSKQKMLLSEAYLIIHGFLIQDQRMLNEWVSIKSPRIRQMENNETKP